MADLAAGKAFGKFITSHPGSGAAIYGAITLLFLWATVHFTIVWLSFPSQPLRGGIQTLLNPGDPAPRWAVVSGFEYRCADKLIETDSDGEREETIPIIDAGGEYLGVLDPSHDSSRCEALSAAEITGTIEPINERRFNYLTAKKFLILKQFPRAKIAQICSGCGPDDSRLGVIILAVITLTTAIPAVILFKRWRRGKAL